MSSFMVFGADISITHGAIIGLNRKGRIKYVRIVGDRVKDVKSVKDGIRVPQAKKFSTDPDEAKLNRHDWLVWSVYKPLLEEIENTYRIGKRRECYFAIEDYAYDSNRQSHQIGEVGGAVRNLALNRGFKIRLHNITEIKMFATNNGNAPKVDVENAIVAACPDIGKLISKIPVGKTRSDVVDSYAIARLLWTEVMVRAGGLALADLPPGPRRVFLRVTKHSAINLLDRPWIELRPQPM